MARRNVFLILLISMVFGQPHPEDKMSCGHSRRLMKLAAMDVFPTADQQKFDVNFYRIELDINPVSEMIYGHVDAEFKIIDSTISVLEIDFLTSMDVTGLKLDDTVRTFSHANDLITIDVPDYAAINTVHTIAIDYSGSPSTTGFGSFNFDLLDGQNMIWTLSEPYGARSWWPCKDDPADKADSVDIIVTVPNNLTVASNGSLKSVTDMGSERIFFWQERYPIPTYLVSLAIYPYYVWYDEYVSTANDTMPIEFYTIPSHFPDLQDNYLKTRPMLEAFSGLFTEYPFINEKYGHAEFGWGGGMEHQTITSLGGYGESLIAHELAHQWWGDMVTCASFHHIWLNEGFATYSEALWWESQYGQDDYHDDMAANAYYGGGTIYVEDPVTVSDIFYYNLTYRKASWIPHMLRHVVGDSLFFHFLEVYATDSASRFNSITTEQFTAIAEAATGYELDTFIDQWVYGSYYPRYHVSWYQNNDSLILDIEQTQSTGTIFQMPLDLEITTADSTWLVVINNSQASQQYAIPVPGGTTVTSILIDPDSWVLKTAQYSYIEVENDLVFRFSLQPAYPNPFNASITIPFEIDYRGWVAVDIFDLQGKNIYHHQDIYQPGSHGINWTGINHQLQPVATGTYFVRLEYPNGHETQKILLLK